MTSGLRIWLMLAPALLVVGLLFGGGLALGVIRSFGHLPAIGLTGPSLDAWRAVLVSPDVWAALATSLWIAGASTTLSVVGGIVAALLVRRHAAGRSFARLLFQMNLSIPHVVVAVGILHLLSQSGLFARAAASAGLVDAPADVPALVFDPWSIGIIVHYVTKEVPFVGVVALAALQAIGEDHEAVARSLGASPSQAFRHVTLPMILPAALSAGAIVFAFTFGAYEVPLLLGQSWPPALPVLAWQAYTEPDLANRPEAMAIALLIAGVGAVLVLVHLAFARRGGLP